MLVVPRVVGVDLVVGVVFMVVVVVLMVMVEVTAGVMMTLKVKSATVWCLVPVIEMSISIWNEK